MKEQKHFLILDGLECITPMHQSAHDADFQIQVCGQFKGCNEWGKEWVKKNLVSI